MEPKSTGIASAPTKSEIIIIQDDINQPEVNALFMAHIAALQAVNTANNQLGHLLDLSGLQHPNITIFTARDAASNELMGCAALRQISPVHAELKSMRTVLNHQRKGVAGALIKQLLDVAKSRGYQRVSLETGIQEDFAPATALYTRSEFIPCEPYEGYEDGAPVEGSVFMTYYID